MSFKLNSFDKKFPDEQSCVEWLITQRWGEEPVCPKCGSLGAYRIKSRNTLKCKECLKQRNRDYIYLENNILELAKISGVLQNMIYSKDVSDQAAYYSKKASQIFESLLSEKLKLEIERLHDEIFFLKSMLTNAKNDN